MAYYIFRSSLLATLKASELRFCTVFDEGTSGGGQAVHTGDQEVGCRFSLHRLQFQCELLQWENKTAMLIFNKIFSGSLADDIRYYEDHRKMKK